MLKFPLNCCCQKFLLLLIPLQHHSISNVLMFSGSGLHFSFSRLVKGHVIPCALLLGKGSCHSLKFCFSILQLQLDFEKSLSVTRLFVGKPAGSSDREYSCVALASSLEKPYSRQHWSLMAAASSMHMWLIISFPNSQSGS